MLAKCKTTSRKYPSVCENSGESLEQEPRVDAFLRQVTETPWYKAFVKEFRLCSPALYRPSSKAFLPPYFADKSPQSWRLKMELLLEPT